MTKAQYDARLLSKYEAKDDCWLFTGCLDRDGYGIIQQNGKAHKAHRKMYELLVGPIPEGCDLHHTCERRACGWPGHLKPKAKSDHGREHNQMLERTHCAQGHEYTEANTAYRPNGHRRCRTCDRKQALESYHRRMRGVSVARQRR